MCIWTTWVGIVHTYIVNPSKRGAPLAIFNRPRSQKPRSTSRCSSRIAVWELLGGLGDRLGCPGGLLGYLDLRWLGVGFDLTWPVGA